MVNFFLKTFQRLKRKKNIVILNFILIAYYILLYTSILLYLLYAHKHYIHYM